MLIYPRSRHRPFDLGPFPQETLPRDPSVIAAESARPRSARPRRETGSGLLAFAAARYRGVFAKLGNPQPARARAPVPDDPARRAVDVRGAAYHMDASQVGICLIPDNAWLEGAERSAHRWCVAILVEHGRVPDPGNLARDIVEPAVAATGDMRAAEIAAFLAGHIAIMGWAAQAHVVGDEALDLERIAVLAGVALRTPEGLVNPFAGVRFSLAAVSTDYELATDRPLAPAAAGGAKGLRYWWGINGAQSGRERARRARRPSHLGSFPMETLRRVERPTTLILDDEVPQVPKRAAFFERAMQGDLGEKAKAERRRFAFKHPTSHSQLKIIRAMVPFQGGDVADVPQERARWADPAANARAVKALSYFLGADVTGICEIPRYAWYSHDTDGTPMRPYHRYAVVMLIDQGFETLEGSSGDDWMSGALSMRAYLRGAEIAGVMAEVLRGCGFSSRAQTNADSDVLQLPLMLWAGLGEMSRIGELVLNPFVGPRLKTVVMTTDLPLEVDRPIDFGLQTFCARCFKCARECPCDAISVGDKVMFNAYEIWKHDVERCARYRVTNSRGSACGRCMKTCPLNKVVDGDGPWLARAASWLGINAMWLKPLMVPIATWADDAIGNGRRNPVKKWWFDLEIVDGVTVAAAHTSERDLDLDRSIDPAKQRIAYVPASMMPPPDARDTPWPVDRKAGLAAAALIETPAAARARRARSGPPPAHYTPRPALGAAAPAAGRPEGVQKPH